jgi:hypothetical protein
MKLIIKSFMVQTPVELRAITTIITERQKMVEIDGAMTFRRMTLSRMTFR